MKRLKILILIFCMTVSIPLAFVVWQTYQRLSQEEHAQMRFFSEALFDEIEKELAELVRREENRAVDEYFSTRSNAISGSDVSPLTETPEAEYILGYLQNNPDGSFQSPLVRDMGRVPLEKRKRVSELRASNTIFNNKRIALSNKQPEAQPKTRKMLKAKVADKLEKDSFADRFISKQQALEKKKKYLGSKNIRRQKISPYQARNLSKEDLRTNKSAMRASKPSSATQAPAAMPEIQGEREAVSEDRAESIAPIDREDNAFQVEVAPLQSVFIREDRYFIFRRIAINNQIYRQGFLLEVTPFLQHLMDTHFNNQPMANFSELQLQVMKNGLRQDAMRTGAQDRAAEVITQRTFPAPFDFLIATLATAYPPPSPARKTLGIAIGMLGLFMLAGLAAIYQSARTIVDLSERRAQFVSSVTHELKTPLTNIRMYIEMLEQGIAATPEREQDYFKILGNESTRLSRLINNVLELAKLEKKQRHFNMAEGDLKDVVYEVRTVMARKLEQEGFELTIDDDETPSFAFDREVLIQVLINLIENSIKFGQLQPEKRITIQTGIRNGMAAISVSDTGPGIPKRALKKIFDDFYRVDNKLTRTTGGTGIGLALVKKFTVAMGGRVEAINNADAGCTITLLLPLS